MDIFTECQSSESCPASSASNCDDKSRQVIHCQTESDDVPCKSLTEASVDQATIRAQANRPKSSKFRRPSKQLYTPPAAKTASPEPSDQMAISNVRTEDCMHVNNCIPLNRIDSSISPSPKHSKSTSDSNQALNSQGKVNNQSDDDASWDNLYDDSGDLIDNQMSASLNSSLTISGEKASKSTPERPCSDFSDYKSSSLSSDINQYGSSDKDDYSRYPHILEVHQFSADFKTKDLFCRISSCGSSDFDILWVDDTHALAVFGSAAAARAALKAPVMSDLSLRPMSEASHASQLKAKSDHERLTHCKKRPQTSLDTARRLVGRHLGVTVHVSRESMLAEKQLLQEARDRRRKQRKQAADAWEGNST